MQNQTNSKYSSNPRDIFKSVKKKPQNRKLNSKEESLELPYLNFSAKLLTEKKTNLKKQYNFCKDVISSEFRDMSQPAKLLRSENFKATIQPLSD